MLDLLSAAHALPLVALFQYRSFLGRQQSIQTATTKGPRAGRAHGDVQRSVGAHCTQLLVDLVRQDQFTIVFRLFSEFAPVGDAGRTNVHIVLLEVLGYVGMQVVLLPHGGVGGEASGVAVVIAANEGVGLTARKLNHFVVVVFESWC